MSKLDSRESQERFLQAFIEHRGDLDEARKSARVTKQTFYGWLDADTTFRDRFDKYRLFLGEEIESEAFKRALNPGNQRGSDALLATLLRGLKKERYASEDSGQKTANVIYISGLREAPRPGAVVEALPDGGPERGDLARTGVPETTGDAARTD
jgi:hypothetical protein